MCESSSAHLIYHKILKTATVISVAARNRESNRQCRIVGLFASQFISQSIQSMLYCQNGVMQQHARTGIAHDFPDSFAHGWLVAMNGAIQTGGLGFTKRAILQPVKGVTQRPAAFITQAGSRSMVLAAIQLYHGMQSSLFTVNPDAYTHAGIINCPICERDACKSLLQFRRTLSARVR